MFDERRAIDVVRTFANYAIVLMHAWAAGQYVKGGTLECRAWDVVCNAFSAAVLPGLFLLSGYLLARNFSVETYESKLWRRVRRLAVPYLVWNLTFVLFYLLAGRIVPRLGQRVAMFGLETWQGACSKVCSLMVAPIDMPTWFMRTLFAYAILSIVVGPLLKWCGGVLVYLALGAWFWMSVRLGWGDALIFTYPFYSALCFVLGMHLSLLKKSPFELFRARGWLACSVLGIAGVAWYRSKFGWSYSIARDVSFVLMTPFLFSVADVLTKVSTKVPRWDFVRSSSFFLYTGHFLFCSIALHALAPVLSGWQGPGKLTLLIAVFCTVGVALNLGFYCICKRMLRRIFGCWDGTL